MHRTSAEILIVIPNAVSRGLRLLSRSVSLRAFSSKDKYPSKVLQNLVTKAIETETKGIRRAVFEKERKVKKKKEI